MASEGRCVWMLSRNCALTPRQLTAFYLSVVGVSLLIATFCAWRGAWMVLPFSLIEVAAVGVALLVYARHAIDCETVSLGRDALLIESVDGSRRSVIRVDRRVARVVVEAHPRTVVSVMARGERIAIGRFIGERERRRFARDLGRALATAA